MPGPRLGLGEQFAWVHYGTATQIRALRQQTLDAAYATNPDRFCGRRPTPPKLPTVAVINQPTPEALLALILQ